MVDQDTREQIERDVVGAPVHDCFDLHPLQQCVCVLLKRKQQKARPKGVNLEHRPVDVDVHAEVLDLYSAINHE